MKKVIQYAAVALMFVIAGSQAVMSQGSKATTVSPKEFQAQWAKYDGFLMDIRTPEEYMAASITRAKLCSFTDPNFEAILDMLDKGTTIYMYDQDGKNSAKAAEMMAKKGFTKVVILQGGLDAWKKAGLEIKNMKK
ncbi:MAG TPA: rhodanese-like domain-containing protein [Bacteroidia bacterium]|nr:rhodanese-like domain-containing protein [Bacteroidia bacterium]